MSNTVIERYELGEGWMWCEECGAKLYSFDHPTFRKSQDKSRRRPYKIDGRCQPEEFKNVRI